MLDDTLARMMFFAISRGVRARGLLELIFIERADHAGCRRDARAQLCYADL
jgi:hypothetical protein